MDVGVKIVAIEHSRGLVEKEGAVGAKQNDGAGLCRGESGRHRRLVGTHINLRNEDSAVSCELSCQSRENLISHPPAGYAPWGV